MYHSTKLKSAQAGFTLIELMIVVVIIGVLAALAIPSYLTYTNKAKFSEVVQAVAPYKVAVELCAQQTGALTNCTTSTNGVPADYAAPNGTTGYTASVSTTAGLITATSQQIGTNYTYILTPTLQTNGQVTWSKTTGTCNAAGLC